EQIRKRLADGEWVVDLRHRVAFAAGHVAGTLNFGLDGSFATYVGWLIPWGTPLTLLADSPDELALAQRELVRIGIDRPAAQATGTPADWAGGHGLESYPRATFADLAQVRHHRSVVVLDTRRALEAAAARIQDATHIPLHDLARRLDEVPDGEVWVHCAAGYRASIAASLLPFPYFHFFLLSTVLYTFSNHSLVLLYFLTVSPACLMPPLCTRDFCPFSYNPGLLTVMLCTPPHAPVLFIPWSIFTLHYLHSLIFLSYFSSTSHVCSTSVITL
ncbi:rhodanese-like domain-containing protein, partial [Actinoplanes nipponensis]|uniref:rhodanese-like domain-containing protein n=1 Tax=Actinoplanes nipponensis TaxID=135950 RepID=UPI0031EE18CC